MRKDVLAYLLSGMLAAPALGAGPAPATAAHHQATGLVAAAAMKPGTRGPALRADLDFHAVFPDPASKCRGGLRAALGDARGKPAAAPAAAPRAAQRYASGRIEPTASGETPARRLSRKADTRPASAVVPELTSPVDAARLEKYLSWHREGVGLGMPRPPLVGNALTAAAQRGT